MAEGGKKFMSSIGSGLKQGGRGALIGGPVGATIGFGKGLLEGGSDSVAEFDRYVPQDQKDLAKEQTRKNILSDERFSAAERDKLLNSLGSSEDFMKGDSDFGQLYRSLTSDPAKLEGTLQANQKRKFLLDQPGLRRQTSLMTGVGKSSEEQPKKPLSSLLGR